MRTLDTFPRLTRRQLKALTSFIEDHENWGAMRWSTEDTWHEALLRTWRQDCEQGVRAQILHALRNTHGPTWLQRYVAQLQWISTEMTQD